MIEGASPKRLRYFIFRFFRKDHLAEHFTTHTKTLPYHCPICNRGFQRQIAMRAHFQNEHVGQHDLVKTCPLCSYRAGSMKSLRIHFFNRFVKSCLLLLLLFLILLNGMENKYILTFVCLSFLKDMALIWIIQDRAVHRRCYSLWSHRHRR